MSESAGDVAKPTKIGRMVYTNFDSHITLKHGIVCEGWPLERFCAPSAFHSRTELQVLHGAWSSGTAKFRRLSHSEMEAFSAEQFEERMDETRRSPTPDYIDPSLVDVPRPTSDQGSGSVSAMRPMMGVMSVSGKVFFVKKPRKDRIDKGSTRGPQRKRVAEGQSDDA